MNILDEDGLALQKWLAVIAYDCYYADSFLSGIGTSAEHRSRWQHAVDMVYRLLSAGLIAPCGEMREDVDRAKFYMPYAERLARNDPFAREVDSVWIELDLCGTTPCRELVERHQIKQRTDGSISLPFLQEISDLFDAASVPWTSFPLVPIGACGVEVPAGGAALPLASEAGG